MISASELRSIFVVDSSRLASSASIVQVIDGFGSISIHNTWPPLKRTSTLVNFSSVALPDRKRNSTFSQRGLSMKTLNAAKVSVLLAGSTSS